MHSWDWVSLDKLGSISRGRQTHYPKNDPNLFWKGTIPFVETQDVKEARLFVRQIRKSYNKKGLKQGKLFPVNTVCISGTGNVSDSALLNSRSCLSANVHGFNSFKSVSDPRFIKYCFDFLPIKKKCICLANTGTAQPMLTIERLLTVKFPNPPFEIQQKIGDVLSAYDELIENCERQIELLEELRTSLYKEWFINLRFPNYEKYEINDGLPKGWKITKLKDLVTFQKGKIPAGSETLNGDFPFFTSSKDSPKRINRYSYDTIAILLTSARYFLVNLYRGKFEASDGCHIVLVNDSSLTYFLLEAIRFSLPDLHAAATGTNYKTLKKEQLEELKINLANDKLIGDFNNFCEIIQLKIESLDAKMRKN